MVRLDPLRTTDKKKPMTLDEIRKDIEEERRRWVAEKVEHDEVWKYVEEELRKDVEEELRRWVAAKVEYAEALKDWEEAQRHWEEIQRRSRVRRQIRTVESLQMFSFCVLISLQSACTTPFDGVFT